MRVVQLVAECKGGIRQHVSDLIDCMSDAQHELWHLNRDGWQLPSLRGTVGTVLHCHGFRASWVARALMYRASKRPAIIVTVHGWPGPRSGPVGDRRVLAWVERRMLVATDVYVAVSSHLSRELAAMGIPPAMIRVLPSTVDSRKFCPGDPTQSRLLLGLPPAELVVGYAGRLSPEKGIDTALSAIALGIHAGRDWRLAVAGAGPMGQKLHAEAKGLGITERVTWLGTLTPDRMPLFYRSIDVLLCPSRQEGQSLVALEALSCAIPVLASEVGGLPETVTPETGVCVPPDQPAAVAAALAGPLSDRKERLARGTAGARLVRERFDRRRWSQAMASIYRSLVVLAAAAVVLNLLPQSVGATPRPIRVVVVIADGLGFGDLWSDSGLSDWASQGAVGLINVATAGRTTRDSAWLTLGAGARGRADACEQSGVNIESDSGWGESAGEVYQRRTGVIPPDGSFVNLDWPLLTGLNWGTSVPGSLGSALVCHGIPVTVLGGSDLPGERGLPAFLAAADADGIVRTAPVDGPYVTDPSAPFGRRLDVSAMLDHVRRSPRPGVAVVDFGDLWRRQVEREISSHPGAVDLLPLVRELGRFVRELTDSSLDGDLFILASLVPDGDYLAPVVLAGDGFMPGTVTSGTTRRRGLVANIDLAPTILTHLQIPIPAGMIGRPVTAVQYAGNVRAMLAEWSESAAVVHRVRPTIVRGYVWLSLAAMVGLAAIALWPVALGLAQWLMLAMMAGPVALMVVPAPSTVTAGVVAYGAAAALLTVLAGTLSATRGWTWGPLLLCWLASTIIILDQVVGARLAVQSVLGYSPIAGARYYGLGNELAGVLLGASIMGTSLFAPRLGRPTVVGASAAGLIITGIVVANPHVGANLGATISLVAAWIAFGIGRTRGAGLAFAGAVVGGLAAAIIVLGWDAFRSASDQSHLGRLATRVLSEGLPALWTVAVRKVDLNLRLVRYTVWSRALVAAVLALFLLSRWPIGAYRKMVRQHPSLAHGVQAATLGAGVALVVNDSGIVTAATAMIYVAGVTGYALLSSSTPRT